MAMNRVLFGLCCLLWISASGFAWAQAGAKPPVLAFLGVEDPNYVFAEAELDRLESQVEALLVADGLKVVEAERVRDFLGDDMCRRAKCWERLGKSLGATKGLRLRIVRSGTVCTLVETMFDAKGWLTIEARTHEAACTVEAVMESFVKTIPRLVLEETGWRGGRQGADKLPERLNDEQIELVFNKHAGDLQRCLDLQKDRDPSVVGKLRLSFRIQNNGRIQQIRILSEEHREAFVAECVSYVLKSMQFPLFTGKAMEVEERQFQLGQ